MATPATLLLTGYGRFGRALVELAVNAGWRVRVHDPVAEVPEELRAASLEALLAEPGVVVPAVPMEAFRASLEALRPFAGPAHVVVDVCSVKAAARRALQEVLGAGVSWAQSHPLFGPMSLELGERPLRVVLCTDTPHGAALAEARRLFQAFGCVLHEQTSEDHDRAMAGTHALAFFVAKGMLAIGADSHEVAPPSFRAMAASIDSVRADAGHLFFPIQHTNPFAAESREGLLDALGRIHRELADARLVGAVDEAGAALAIAPPRTSPELGEARATIDALDQELMALLARRAQVALRAARAKAGEGRAVQDPGREEALLERRRELALEHDLDPTSVTDVFEAILRFSRGAQRRFLDSNDATGEVRAPDTKEPPPR